MSFAPAASDYGKRFVELVDLILDFCTRVHSTSPCTAARNDGAECFNTLRWCQDRPNYDKTTKTYRFSLAAGPLLLDQSTFPRLISVSLQPGRIDPRNGLGGGEQVTMHFEDWEHNDVGVDPYVRLRPLVQGTFWPKLLVRNPNYQDRAMVYRFGYAAPDGSVDLTAMRTRTYFLTSIDPDDQRCVVRARDPLQKLVGLQLPLPTEVELSASLAAGATSATVKSGQGALLGSAPFLFRVGDELITAGAIATDSLTSLVRGEYGTDDVDHAADDRVQKCRVYTDARVDDIWSDLLNADGDGVDASYIDTANAETEVDSWLPSFLLTRVISKPTKVTQLLAELMQDSACFQWYDPESALVKMLHTHPRQPGEVAVTLSDEANLLAGTVRVQMDDDRRITRTVVYYGVTRWDLDVGKQDPEEPAFSRVAAYIDADAESALEYGSVRPRLIYAAFLPADLEVEARVMAYRSTARYRDQIRRVIAEVSDKDAADIALGDGVDISSAKIVDRFGAQETIQARVIEKRPLENGRWRLTAEDTGFAGVRWAFYAPPATADYPDDDQYAHYSDSSGLMADGTDGWVYI